MTIMAVLVDACVALAYFLMAYYWAPILVKSGNRWVWWLTLLGVVCLSYAICLWPTRRSESRKDRSTVAVTIAHLLLLFTLFSYDGSIRPYLEAHAVGWLWIVVLAMTLLWVGISAVAGSRLRCRPIAKC